MNRSTRRGFLALLGATALVFPLAARAQPRNNIWRIGFLGELDRPIYAPRFEAFKAGFRELDYLEARDYVIEPRFAQADLARLPALMAELLAAKVDVVITSGTPSTVAARNATRDVPILITTVTDPVGSGLAASLARPGGNVTGLTQDVGAELYTKRLDLLRQILPGMRRVGFLHNPAHPSDASSLKQFEADCSKLQFQAIRAPASKREEIPAAFGILKRERAQGLIVSSSSSNNAWRASITERAARERLPAAYGNPLFADAGGLISYSANRTDLYRRIAAYAVKIFKGARPGDLPIEQPTVFELIVNLKTARALGIRIPDTVLLRADKVIE